MKTGIVRRVDDLGRIVIPKEVRIQFDIKEGDPLEITIEGNKICFELYNPTECYEDRVKRLIECIKEEEHPVTNKQTVISALELAKDLLRSENNGL